MYLYAYAVCKHIWIGVLSAGGKNSGDTCWDFQWLRMASKNPEHTWRSLLVIYQLLPNGSVCPWSYNISDNSRHEAYKTMWLLYMYSLWIWFLDEQRQQCILIDQFMPQLVWICSLVPWASLTSICILHTYQVLKVTKSVWRAKPECFEHFQPPKYASVTHPVTSKSQIHT